MKPKRNTREIGCLPVGIGLLGIGLLTGMLHESLARYTSHALLTTPVAKSEADYRIEQGLNLNVVLALTNLILTPNTEHTFELLHEYEERMETTGEQRRPDNNNVYESAFLITVANELQNNTVRPWSQGYLLNLDGRRLFRSQLDEFWLASANPDIRFSLEWHRGTVHLTEPFTYLELASPHGIQNQGVPPLDTTNRLTLGYTHTGQLEVFRTPASPVATRTAMSNFERVVQEQSLQNANAVLFINPTSQQAQLYLLPGNWLPRESDDFWRWVELKEANGWQAFQVNADKLLRTSKQTVLNLSSPVNFGTMGQ